MLLLEFTRMQAMYALFHWNSKIQNLFRFEYQMAAQTKHLLFMGCTPVQF